MITEHRKGLIVLHAELAEEGERAPEQRKRATGLSIAAWLLIAVGAAGVMTDGAFGLPSAAVWAFTALTVLGAALFALSAWMKTPKSPGFLQELMDPWENHN